MTLAAPAARPATPYPVAPGFAATARSILAAAALIASLAACGGNAATIDTSAQQRSLTDVAERRLNLQQGSRTDVAERRLNLGQSGADAAAAASPRPEAPASVSDVETKSRDAMTRRPARNPTNWRRSASTRSNVKRPVVRSSNREKSTRYQPPLRAFFGSR